ncbi:alanine dehydrogenase [Atopobacter phocae]|uniref:alanine dehydrogenase n=1 Tax=Atopobacter phocae TaxID=136492 RepID=UPI0004728EFF|nr:alanine dehydrogenase [Atopobacter phocae]
MVSIGIPKEIKNNEKRVGMTAQGVSELIRLGATIYVEQDAGIGSGITNEEYIENGAIIKETAEEVWAADIVVKVKEPQPEEYGFFRPNLTIYTYFHLANEPKLAQALKENQVTAIGYETMVGPNGDLPLLTPMSTIAGRLAVETASHFLGNQYGGQGILIGGIPGVKNGKVVIIGGGTAGRNAVQTALGLGAHVTVLDIKMETLTEIEQLYGKEIVTLMSNPTNIAEAVKDADIVVGTVLIPGAKAPKLVTEEMVKSMKPGSVIVDVAVDQGGIFETEDRVTTHDDPVYIKHGVLHYAVANMPGAVARTSTIALTNVTLPYLMTILRDGLEESIKNDSTIQTGINTYKGHITNEAVATALDMTSTEILTLIH